jgi:hypothetical protein
MDLRRDRERRALPSDCSSWIDATYLAEKPADAVTRSFELHRPEPLIAALGELAGGKIRALEIAEDDVIVFRCALRLDQAATDRVSNILREQFGGKHKVVVLDGGAELQTVRALQ